MTKVLIFGINGFTGFHFQKYILEKQLYRQYSFLGVDRQECLQNSSCKHITADCSNSATVEDIISTYQPDYILNLIGGYSTRCYDTLLLHNATISKYILQAIKTNTKKIKSILLIGSAAEYGCCPTLPITESCPLNPINLYGLSKLIQTQYMDYYYQNYGVQVSLARTFNLIGPNIPASLAIGTFFQQLQQIDFKGKLYVGNLSAKRDYLDIRDAVEAYWKLLMNSQGGQVYNVCSETSVSMHALLSAMIEKNNKKLELVIDKHRFKANDIPTSFGSYSKLNKQTGWNPKYSHQDSINAMFGI